MKKVEIINIGTELLTGKLNTNAQYLSIQVSKLGLVLSKIVTIPDNKNQIIETLKDSLLKADIVIISGGLGPTFDDITLESISEVVNKKLIRDQNTIKKIKDYAKIKGKIITENNLKQARIFEDSVIFDNKAGICPGQILTFENKKALVLLPGPPHELTDIFKNHVFNYLKENYSEIFVTKIKIKTFGLSESDVNDKIKKIVDTEKHLAGDSVRFSIIVSSGIVEIICFIYGQDEIENEQMGHRIKDEIYSLLKNNIFGENEDTLEMVVGLLLLKNKNTIAIAESVTGGHISSLITNVSGSSIYFKGGIVAYSDYSKKKILNIDTSIIRKFSDVSGEVAVKMAENVRKLYNTDFGLSVTGYAGPSGGTKTNPVGTIYCGVAFENRTICQKEVFTGTRKEIKEKMSNFALNSLRKAISGIN